MLYRYRPRETRHPRASAVRRPTPFCATFSDAMKLQNPAKRSCSEDQILLLEIVRFLGV